MNNTNIDNHTNDTNDDQYDLKKLFNLLRFFWAERIRFIIIIFGFALIGLIYSLILTPWYESNIKILPNFNEGSTISNQYSGLAAIAGINLQTAAEEKMMVYPEIIKSNFVIDRLLAQKFKIGNQFKEVTLYEYFNVEVDSSVNKSLSTTYIEVEKFKKMIREKIINTDYDANTGVLNLKIQFPDNAKLAADIANFIVEQLDDYNKNYRKYKATEQIRFIQNSIDETSENLDIAEKKLEKYQEQNKDLNSPKNLLEYERLKTELEVHRNIYIELKKQLEIKKIEEIKETVTLNILEEAVVPHFKFKPKRTIILIISIFLGFIISSIYILIKVNWQNIKKILYNN